MDRDLWPVRGPGNNVVPISFKFTLNGTGTIAASSFDGAVSFVVSVVYAASTGKYTVTMKDPVPQVIYADAAIDGGSAHDGAYGTCDAFQNEGTSSPLAFTLSTFSGGGALTNFTARICRVMLWVRNSSVKG